MKEEELLIGQLEDKINQASEQYMLAYGDFLDTHLRKIATDYLRSKKIPVKAIFYGGYEDAERCLPVFLPDYIEFSGDGKYPEEVKELLSIVRVTVPKGGRRLTHRDYLGSLMGLGIDRNVTGDILVREEGDRKCGGADIIVETSIAKFLELNYDKVGRTNLKVEVLPIDMLETGKINIEEKTDTVASMRLDNIVSAAFGVSRTRAAEAIRKGIVAVNSEEILKVDTEIREMDKIVMRGRGKVVLKKTGASTRKGRIRVFFNIYK